MLLTVKNLGNSHHASVVHFLSIAYIPIVIIFDCATWNSNLELTKYYKAIFFFGKRHTTTDRQTLQVKIKIKLQSSIWAICIIFDLILIQLKIKKYNKYSKFDDYFNTSSSVEYDMNRAKVNQNSSISNKSKIEILTLRW